MKPEELDELAAEVAEKVMGWKLMSDGSWLNDGNYMPSGWSPPTDISAAFEVVEKIRNTKLKDNHVFQVDFHNWNTWDKKWMVGFHVSCSRADNIGFCPHLEFGVRLDSFISSAPTAPHAICLAALKAVEK